MADDRRGTDHDPRGDRGRDDRRPRERRWRIDRLNVPEKAAYTETGPEIVVSAFASLGGKIPERWRPEGQWFLDGNTHGGLVELNERGGTTKPILLTDEAVGWHTVTFKLLGEGYEVLDSKTRDFLIPPPPKQKTAEQERKEQAIADFELDTKLAKAERDHAEARRVPERHPAKLSVEPLGFKPSLRFIIHLTDNESRGTAGKVEISNYAGEVWEVDVDASGSALWPPCDQPAITFAEKRRTYRFRIAGADPEDKTRARECVVS